MICEIMAQNIELKCGKCARTAIYYTTEHDLGGGIQGNSKKNNCFHLRIWKTL